MIILILELWTWIFCKKNFFIHFTETEEQQKTRFQTELEFVQCLANPNYLNCKY